MNVSNNVWVNQETERKVKRHKSTYRSRSKVTMYVKVNKLGQMC